MVLLPGLVDLQVNGFRGLDVNAPDVSPDDVVALTEELARVGVTTWVPTIVTAPEERIQHALEQVTLARDADPVVARAIPLVHVEGPFISDQDGPRGVHDGAAIRPLDAAEVQRWVAAHRVARMVTVSPHAADAPDQIRAIRALGVQVSIGHTHATPEQLRRAVDAGHGWPRISATASRRSCRGTPTPSGPCWRTTGSAPDWWPTATTSRTMCSR